ncbi:hypothetical protein KTH_21820 [Thermosporothrix hazakensis]|nr:hypothetical protein KTH_21820 [Thermosporothrix hazakensis]
MIVAQQSAIILTGAPRIGKTSLIRYLQGRPENIWSWRHEEELTSLQDLFSLDTYHFVQIDLTPLEVCKHVQDMLPAFVTECFNSLSEIHHISNDATSIEVQDIRDLLRTMNLLYPNDRYFVMLDSIEKLDRPDITFPELESSGARSPQERGIALLNHCGAIRILVDLIDEFACLNVILSIESLPLANIEGQFENISADLARFYTMPLQCFTRKDAMAFLAQDADSFGPAWAKAFRRLGGEEVFSLQEQQWILQQAGSHPYLLQQFCYQLFYLKQLYADMYGQWKEVPPESRAHLVEQVNAGVATFLIGLWKRLTEALASGGQDAKDAFAHFVLTLKQREEVLSAHEWQALHYKIRYILVNEGIVRYDPFQPIYLPGSLLCHFLRQQQFREYPTQLGRTASFSVSISLENRSVKQLSLTELEYRLLKVLMEHPLRCSSEVLMKEVWGKMIERSTLSQRLYHLRKKLRKHSGVDFIANHYGGHYSLRFPDRLRFE